VLTWKPVSLRRLLPYAVLVAEVLLFFRQVLFQEGYVIPWDLRYFHYPHAEFIAESFRRGELPLWDPYTYCGRPFFANIQTELFYPPLWLTVLASNLTGGARLFYWLEWEVVLHVFLAGIFAFWLLRRLGAGAPAALLGATVFQLGGFFASQAQHMGAVNAAAWMPLAWLCVIALAKTRSWRWLAGLAASFAMSVLSGLPAVTIAVVGSAMLLALVLVLFRAAPLRLPLAVLLSAVWALALSAIQFLPTAELNRHSISQYRSDWLQTGGGLPLASLVSLVAPDWYGIFDLKTYSAPYQPTFLYLYCGILGLSLAVMASLVRRTREAAVFAVLSVACALWMLGDSTPVGRESYRLLPEFVRAAVHPEFAMPAWTLTVAVLAGLGAEQFLRRPVLAWSAVAVCALDLTLAGSGRSLNTASLRDEPGVTPEHFEGSRATLQRMRLLVTGTTPPARIDSTDASMNWAMSAPLIRIPTANGNDPLALLRPMQVRLAFAKGERWGAYYQISDLESPVVDLVGIRYILSRRALEPGLAERAGLVHVADLAGEKVYENTQALPRFYLVNRLRPARNLEEAAALLRSRNFAPRVEAVVEGALAPAAGAGGAVRVLHYAARRVELEVDAPAAAFLVTSETHYPGWRAYLDGRERPIYYTNVAFRGVAVPAGRHRVVFEFAPGILWWGCAVSAAAWIAMGVLCVRRRAVAHTALALLP